MAEPTAYVAVGGGSDGPRLVPIAHRLVVGRECPGVADGERLLIDDPTVSRWHLEIRIDPTDRRAVLVDTSTNGTRVNGMRVRPGAPHPLQARDRIKVGDTELEFRPARPASGALNAHSTTKSRRTSTLVLVVGDIVGYSTITERAESEAVLSSIETIFSRIRALLTAHGGSLKDYIGDAVFAIWEPETDPDAVASALRFVVDARAALEELAPSLPIRSPDGSPLRMGWAVVLGDAIEAPLEGSYGGALVGDAVNLAFRLSGLAARDGRADLLVTARVAERVADLVALSPAEEVRVKGRKGGELVHGVLHPASRPPGSGSGST